MTKLLPILAILAGTNAAEPKKEPDVAWEVKPDAMPWKFDGPVPADKTIALVGNNSVVYPTSLSPFFGIIVAEKKADPVFKMYDLRRMEQVGQPFKFDKTVPDLPKHLRVSPWGDYFAVMDNKTNPPTVWLGSVTDEKPVTSIVPHEGKEKLECVDFAGKGQIITCMETDKKRSWRIWDIKTGKQVLSFDFGLEYAPNWMSFSPTRRYLAMEETHTKSYRLIFWDLQTGKQVGNIPMQEPTAEWGQCGNLAWSNDGRELALIWTFIKKEGPSAKIMRFDLEKGTKIGELSLTKDVLEPAAPGLLIGGLKTFQFLPDDRGWLISGCQIIERETGASIYVIEPHAKSNVFVPNRRFLDATHLTDATGGKVLKILTLPKPELDAAFAKAKSQAKDAKN